MLFEQRRVERVNTAYICEQNPLIREDLREILLAFDSRLQIHEIASVEELAAIAVVPDSMSLAIVNGDSATYAGIDFIEAYQEAGGRVLSIGVIGPTRTPPSDWIVVDTPFTTQSIHAALQIALSGRSA